MICKMTAWQAAKAHFGSLEAAPCDHSRAALGRTRSARICKLQL
jgi:hypothetical protein